jgi:hypothetical protein
MDPVLSESPPCLTARRHAFPEVPRDERRIPVRYDCRRFEVLRGRLRNGRISTYAATNARPARFVGEARLSTNGSCGLCLVDPEDADDHQGKDH